MKLKRIDDDLRRVFQAGLPPEKNAGFLGGDVPLDQASLVIIPVPWEPTTSYGKGTAAAPTKLIKVSHQLDLEDPFFGTPYEYGIRVDPIAPEIIRLNQEACEVLSGAHTRDAIEAVNERSRKLNEWLREKSARFLQAGHLVACLGGDHSSPLGLIQAIDEHLGADFGILHFDAHHDLREKFEGFEFSHASIMHQVLATTKRVKKLVQVGIRDFSREEKILASSDARIKTYYDHEIAQRALRGEAFSKLAREIVDCLPQKVYVSFDIDGLDPTLCPNTGTPVPGGLSFNAASFLLAELENAGKTIIGFDLCEVSQGEATHDWDLNVGARLLYKLAGATLSTWA